MSELLTRDEAAQVLRVKPQTLATWAATKRYGLPFVKIGKLAMYQRSDLERFIASRTVGAVHGK
jgi:excisionase family DNA binding protein